MLDDLERQYRRDAKVAIVGWFDSDAGRAALDGSALAALDPRIRKYFSGLGSQPAAHNLFELLAVRRAFDFEDKYEFRPGAAREALVVIESLRFPTDKGLQPIVLSPVQVFLLAHAYGFYDAAGQRVIRNVFLFVPRKFGKTTLTAGICINELLFGPPDGQVFACANSYDQAKICFDIIRQTVAPLDRGGRRFKINREKIFSMMKGRTAFARCLASNPDTLDGLNASCYVLDEYAQAKSPELRNVMATSQGTRENPLEIIITTASSVTDGPCVDTLEAYRNILLGRSEDDSVLALIFEPDVDDREDDPKTWKKVQPNWGITVRPDYYRRAYTKALESADNMVAFRTKLLNVFCVNEKRSWITANEVTELFADFDFNNLSVRPFANVAFDLSVWDDFTAVAYEMLLPNDDGNGKHLHFHVDYYIPEDSVDRHPRRDLYRKWIAEGYLKALPGKIIDYESVAKDIMEKRESIAILGIGYDPYKSKTATSVLAAAGASKALKPIRQTYGSFTGPVETLELLIKQGKATFSPNPITAWCFSNCIMDEDRMGNKKPIKREATAKIDGAICCLQCQYLFDNFKK